MTKRPVTAAEIDPFIEGAQAKIDDYYAKHYKNLKPSTLSVSYGKRYAKVIDHMCNGQRSAWAFIDLTTGDILKSASWKAPAKHARGTVLTETHGVEFVGPYGPAYLR